MKGAASFERMDLSFERASAKTEVVEFLDPGIIGLLEAHAFGRFVRGGTLCIRPGCSGKAMVILIKSGRISKEPLGARRRSSRRVDEQRGASDRRASQIETVESASLTRLAVVLLHKQRHCR